MNHYASFLAVLSVLLLLIAAGSPLEYTFGFLPYLKFLVAFVFLFFLTIFFSLHGRISGDSLGLFAFILILIVYISVPFRPYDDSVPLGFLTLGLAAASYALLPREVKILSVKLFVNSVCLISIVSVLSSFFLFVGMDLPSWRLYRPTSGSDYNLYVTGVYSLTTNITHMPWGGELIRSLGIFKEPGHFSAILSAAFILNGMKVFDFKSMIIVIAGFLTFSPVFYFVFLFFIMISFFSLKVDYYKLIGPIFVLSLFFVIMFDPGYLQRLTRHFFALFDGSIFYGRLGPGESLTYYVDELFSKFNLFFGLGMNIEHPSNIWSWVFRFGLLSIALIASTMLPLLMKINRFVVLGLFFFVMLVAHRAWMLSDFWVWFYLINLHSISFCSKLSADYKSNAFVVYR